MEKFTLIPVKYFYISFNKISIFNSYRLSEMEYGGTLIFYGVTPGYYLNLLWKGCGDCLPEVEMLAKKYKRDIFSVVNNILKKTTNRRLQNRPHLGNKVYLSFIWKDYARDHRTMPLELLDLDPYWNLLDSNDIKRILKKSRRRW